MNSSNRLGLSLAVGGIVSLALVLALIIPAMPAAGQGPDPTPGLEAETAEGYLARADYFANTAYDMPAAIADATSALDLDPGLVGAYVVRGQAYLGTMMVKHALVDFNAALAFEPDNVAALAGRGLAHVFWAGYGEDVYQAAADAERVLELDPGNAEAWIIQNSLAVWELQFDTGIEVMDAAVEANPDSGILYYWRARAYRSLRGTIPEVRENFVQAAELLGDSPWGLLAQGEVLLESGEYADGWDVLRAALDRYPAYPWLHNEVVVRYGQIAGREGVEAVNPSDLYTRALEAAPESLPLLLMRANAYQGELNHAAALDDFEAVLALDPEYGLAYLQMVVSYTAPGSTRDCDQAIWALDMSNLYESAWQDNAAALRGFVTARVDDICDTGEDVVLYPVDNPLLADGSEITVPGFVIFSLSDEAGTLNGRVACTSNTIATVLRSVTVEGSDIVWVELECDGGIGWAMESDLVN